MSINVKLKEYVESMPQKSIKNFNYEDFPLCRLEMHINAQLPTHCGVDL